ncbi:MAG: UDP-N-acetylglucosamine 1-carboxyvinyltransferase [Clostridiales bacterium]|nr:UDP-N-acetylglucosamine 1-carboxyvinyltransferase [Clostridiales bacterium]MDY3763678.1 UDP-N-acetylglucosamine 1-carboxyvinyltransferase [Candidatus Ventricola sp.]MCI6587962.1 UDP-N-acetylglucosamine 1-carboxyvinyltransferase [Clostridiales bacterium]MCI7704374.1 UDP-N-acetylglucosamine 1-carboxyvinyltransferase [Clostridiales bacterium]MDY3831850.1 UDP-N-acetylglucosamine 1-carboxyvinyltransferase [Candidatus Ventricola sp.]
MAEERMLITGGQRLEGAVRVSGGKNTAVAIIPAAILSQTPCVIENLPSIEDVHVSVETLQHLGARVVWDPKEGTMEVDASTISRTDVPLELCRRMRASSYYIGALLARFGEASVPLPGGCNIGRRPIDQHIKGMRMLGAEVEIEGGTVVARARNGLVGGDVFMDMVTVGGTINVMLAAACAQGTTTIYNAAKEPHIVDTANFLNSMGCKVKGAGTDVIRVRGVQSLSARRPYAVIPDQIETGTLMIAAAATHGDVTISGCIPTHMEALTAKLLEMGARVDERDDSIRVRSMGAHRGVTFKTQVYPGFPTDLQQPMSALLCTATGTSTVVENIFESRFRHLMEMERMGARVRLFEQTAVIEGVPQLHGAAVEASDLRAGAALVIAGLMAQGTTEISNTHYIDRGYEHLETKLSSLGAKISRVMY